VSGTGTSQGPAGTHPAWRVYGIVPAETALPDWAAVGPAVRKPELLRHGQIAAVVEPLDSDQRLGRRDLLAHAEVLNAIAEHGPVVPVAFGSAFAERDQVITELLAPQETALASMLDQLRGQAQFLLRLRYAQETLLAMIIAGDPEIAELREQTRQQPEDSPDNIRLGELVVRAVEARQAEDSDRVLATLGPVAADSKVSGRTLTNGTVTLAFLVPDRQRAEFEAAAEEIAAQLADRAAVELQGPLAPFDFVPSL